MEAWRRINMVQAEYMDEIRLEDGYLILANRLVEVMYSSNFNATQVKILLFIIRYTYGFKRKSHKISVSFISTGTGISRRYIKQELGKLIEGKVIDVKTDYTCTQSRTLSINKNIDEWLGWGTILPQVNNTSPDEQSIPSGGEQLFPSGGEQLIPQEIKNKSKKESKERNTHEDLFEKLWEQYPNKKGKSSIKPTTKKKLLMVGEEKLVKAIEVYKKDLELNKWKQPMNGSTFFNGRYTDYLVDESEEHEKIDLSPKLNDFSKWK